MAGSTLYIIYNASGTVAGKLIYGYRKLTTPSKSKSTSPPTATAECNKSEGQAGPVCAACDITHGGLSLRETPAWAEAKKEIETRGDGLRVVQLHRNEVPENLKAFVKSQQIRYPAVILEQDGSGSFTLTMDSQALAECDGDPKAFLEKIRDRGVIQKEHSSRI